MGRAHGAQSIDAGRLDSTNFDTNWNIHCVSRTGIRSISLIVLRLWTHIARQDRRFQPCAADWRLQQVPLDTRHQRANHANLTRTQCRPRVADSRGWCAWSGCDSGEHAAGAWPYDAVRRADADVALRDMLELVRGSRPTTQTAGTSSNRCSR